MSLRQNIGNRIIKEPPALAKGPEYLIPCACFFCRKCFKKPESAIPSSCPQCANELHEMGRNFTPPKATDKEQWPKVELLWKAGFRFVGSGNYDAPKFPERLRDVEKFISKNPEHPMKIIKPIQ